MSYISAALVGNACLTHIKSMPWFPYKTGNLKYNATRGEELSPRVYRITFDSIVAPYIPYLEEGTGPHNIPKAFGKPLPFGTSGRFNGMFHPGSTKHKGFISEKAVNAIVNYICYTYGGQVIDVTTR